jgi:hypothetical protein
MIKQMLDIDLAHGLEFVPPKQNPLAVDHMDRIVLDADDLVEIDNPTDMTAIKGFAQEPHKLIHSAVIAVLTQTRAEYNQSEPAFRVQDVFGINSGGFGARENRDSPVTHRKSSFCRANHPVASAKTRAPSRSKKKNRWK